MVGQFRNLQRPIFTYRNPNASSPPSKKTQDFASQTPQNTTPKPPHFRRQLPLPLPSRKRKTHLPEPHQPHPIPGRLYITRHCLRRGPSCPLHSKPDHTAPKTPPSSITLSSPHTRPRCVICKTFQRPPPYIYRLRFCQRHRS